MTKNIKGKHGETSEKKKRSAERERERKEKKVRVKTVSIEIKIQTRSTAKLFSQFTPVLYNIPCDSTRKVLFK